MQSTYRDARQIVIVDAARCASGSTCPLTRLLKNRCVSGSVLSTIKPSIPRVSSTVGVADRTVELR